MDPAMAEEEDLLAIGEPAVYTNHAF